MRRVVLVSLAGLLTLSRPSVAGQPTDDPYAGIRDVLARRADAMLAGERRVFLATIDPSDEAFAKRQRLLFDGFRRLGLSSYRLGLDVETWPELTTDRERARHGEEARVLHVEERYAIRGYDEQPALDDLFLTFAPSAEGWRIVSDTDLEDLTLYSGRKLWEFGPVVTRESEHFLYVSHPDLAGAAPQVLSAAEEALDAVVSRWPLPWSRRVAILAPSGAEELGRMIQATFDLDVFVAFATSGVDRSEDWDLVGHRVLLSRPNFARLAPSTQREILTHELLHVATRERSGPHVPVFVDEGVADWVSREEPGAILAARVGGDAFDRRLPLDHEFITGDDDDILLAYQESTAAVTYAAERFGADAVAGFYDSLGAVRRAPGTWRYHVGRAMGDAFGLGYRTFERDWAEWTEEQFS